MKVAFFNGLLGFLLTLGLGVGVVELTALQSLWAGISSCIAGMASLLLTLRGEQTPWFKRHVFTRQARTWIFFLGLYFAVLFLLAPYISPLTSLRRFMILFLPLVLCSGWTIMAFGPLQDRLVARIQRKARHLQA